MIPQSNPPPLAVDGHALVKRLRWVMTAVILVDIALTLSGQPPSYWKDPSTVDEGNRLFHQIMSKGIMVTLLVDLIYVSGSVLLVSILPWRVGLTLLLALVLGHFFGGSTWLCFRYQLGATGMVLYGLLLAVVFVIVAFPLGPKNPRADG